MKSSQKYIGVRLCLKQGREKQDYIKNLGQEFQEDAPVKDICYTERERVRRDSPKLFPNAVCHLRCIDNEQRNISITDSLTDCKYSFV